MIYETGQVRPDNAKGGEALPSGSRRLSVLHVGKFYPPHKGGIETHLQTLCGELAKSVQLQVLVAGDNQHPRNDVMDHVAVCRVPTRLTVCSAPVCPGMLSKIRSCGADIVHLHWPNPTAVLAYLASRRRGHLIVTYHSDTVRQRFLGAMFEPCLHSLLRRSSAIIATSPDYIQTSPILSRYRERCHLIPLGIDQSDFDDVGSAQVNALRRDFGDRLVLSVGRLVYYKGFEYLIRAMSHVRGKLLIVGDGPLRHELQKLVCKLGLTDKVFLLGEIPGKLTRYYQAADVFALASVARAEAFGIVQVEAMAAGLPVVNTKLDSGVPFVSLDQKTGLTVPPLNAGALAEALNRLLDDSALRQTLGSAARLRARQEFSLETMTARTLKLYEDVMNGRISDSAR